MILLTYFFVFINYVTSQNFPSYWEGKISTFDNGSTSVPVPIIMLASVHDYQTTNNSKGEKLIKSYQKALKNDKRVKIEKQYLPNNEEPQNGTGIVRAVTFKDGVFTWMEVVEAFNHDNTETIPVKFGTSWNNIDESQSIGHDFDHLSEAVENGTVLNITVTMEYRRLTDEESLSLNKDKMVEIDTYLCYYGTNFAKLINNRCFIPFRDVIESFKVTWNPDAIQPPAIVTDLNIVSNDEKLVNDTIWCTNNTQSSKQILTLTKQGRYRELCSYLAFWEGVKYVSPDEVFLLGSYIYYELNSKPAGVGMTSNITFGTNKTLKTYDFNFTVEFSNWTIDFPEGMLNSYMDIAFKYEKFRLKVYYWNPVPLEKPVRGVPPSFWVIMIIWAVVLAIVMFAVALTVCTRFHKFSFNVDLWDYWHNRRQYRILIRKHYEDHKLGIAEMEEELKFSNYQREYEKMIEEMDKVEEEEKNSHHHGFFNHHAFVE